MKDAQNPLSPHPAPRPSDRPGGPAGLLAVFAVLVAAAVAAGALSFASSPEPRNAQRGSRVVEPQSAQQAAGHESLDAADALTLVLAMRPELRPAHGGPYTYEARHVLSVEDQTVLIAAAESADALPTVTGSLGIFYLRRAPSGYRLTGFWPAMTIGAPMGRPPEFRVSEAFGSQPVLVVLAREVRAGIACELTQLVELGPSGPLASDPFVSASDARGARGPSGRAWTGQVQDIVSNAGFTLQTGEGSIPFVRTNGRYAPAAGYQPPQC